MSDFKSLMTQPSEKEIKSYQRYFKQSLKEARKYDREHPIPNGESSYLGCHLFNMAYNAVSQRDEALLDQLYAEHEAQKPGDERYRHHILYNRACLRVSQHRFEEAIAMLKELEANDYYLHRSHTLHLLVDIYEHLEDFKAAAGYVHKYFEYWDKDNQGRSTFANYSGLNYMLKILIEAGEYESVVKYGEERIKQNYPGEQYLHFMVAQCCLNLKDFEKGLKYYKYIFKYRNPYPEAFVNVGEYYGIELGDWDNALKYYVRAIKACGKDPDYTTLKYRLFHNFKPFFIRLDKPARANWHRRNLFKAMGTPMLSDLVFLFSRDPATIDVYRAWLQEKLAEQH